MSGNVEFVLNPQRTKTRRGAYQVTLAQSQDWMRVWPCDEDTNAGFRLGMLPIRLLSVALLWTTSTPGRFLFGVAAAAAVALGLILR